MPRPAKKPWRRSSCVVRSAAARVPAERFLACDQFMSAVMADSFGKHMPAKK